MISHRQLLQGIVVDHSCFGLIEVRRRPCNFWLVLLDLSWKHLQLVYVITESSHIVLLLFLLLLITVIVEDFILWEVQHQTSVGLCTSNYSLLIYFFFLEDLSPYRLTSSSIILIVIIWRPWKSSRKPKLIRWHGLHAWSSGDNRFWLQARKRNEFLSITNFFATKATILLLKKSIICAGLI